jgi:hypothetical protein
MTFSQNRLQRYKKKLKIERPYPFFFVFFIIKGKNLIFVLENMTEYNCFSMIKFNNG